MGLLTRYIPTTTTSLCKPHREHQEKQEEEEEEEDDLLAVMDRRAQAHEHR